MSDRKWKRENSIALVLAVLLHLALIFILLWIIIPKVEAVEQGAVLVNVGIIDDAPGALGASSPTSATATTPPPPPSPSPATEQELLTQNEEPAPTVVKKVKTPKPIVTNQIPKEKKRVKTSSPSREKLPSKAELEAKARAEKAAREKAEAERQAAIANAVSGAFSSAKNRGNGSSDKGSGQQGSPKGNVNGGGIATGTGGYGSYSLDGRHLMGESLPKPSYSSQVEGRIVVSIVVDPSGRVISASIAPGTTIEDYKMKNSALQSAKKARFNSIKGLNNQVGNITYIYRLK